MAIDHLQYFSFTLVLFFTIKISKSYIINPTLGQTGEPGWPFLRTHIFNDIEIAPFSDKILYTLARTSYQMNVKMDFDDSGKYDVTLGSNYNKAVLKVIPAFMYYQRNNDYCHNNETDVYGVDWIYEDYCCDKNDKGRLVNCTIKIKEKFNKVIDSISYESGNVNYNEVSYANQGLDIWDLGNLILESFKVQSKKTRFTNYVHHFIVIENKGNETIGFSTIELYENSNEYVSFSYFIFSTLIFSELGFALWTLIFFPICCTCIMYIFFCSFLCICLRSGGIEHIEKEEKKLNEKATSYGVLIREQILEIKQVKKEYYSLYNGFKEDKKKSILYFCMSLLKYIINGETLLQILFLSMEKICFICTCDKYKNSKCYKQSYQCFQVFRDEERDKHNYYFTKKFIFFFVIVFISFFTSLIIETYVLESFILPNQCSISELASHQKIEDLSGISDEHQTVRFLPQTEGDSEVKWFRVFPFTKISSMMKVEGRIELNPNYINAKYPFESYYEKILYSEFSFMTCQFPPVNMSIDPRPPCNKSSSPMDLYTINTPYACDVVTDQFNFWFYKILCSLISFILLFIPLYIYEKSFYWDGGPFCFGMCCKNCIKDKQLIRGYHRKNCCASCVFCISCIVAISWSAMVIYQVSLWSRFTFGGVFASFVINAIGEIGYEIFILVLKYFCCCGWSKATKLEKSVKEIVKETKVLEKKKEKIVDTIVSDVKDLKEVELKKTKENESKEDASTPEEKKDN